ncbi:hypothetical protein F0160_22620 [Paraburkholderia sp. JPY303]|uniref:hypothetical protein n=1 Tax=Paraburkholderia atlantica TaxID=2654982 RepID=UPI001592799D|nr:hypothetical protein [Paraburkholderia atlantica]NUY33282.1 hypothetical protein [Paraburkholderia atlantica]
MDLRALEARLENWARAQRSGGYTPGRATSAEGMYRGGGWREARPAPIQPDLADAAVVQDAWRVLMPFDKDVLMLYYVWRAPSSFICRRLKLKQGRGHAHVWEFALYHAQNAIAQRLEKVEDKFVNSPKLAYTRAQPITDSEPCSSELA